MAAVDIKIFDPFTTRKARAGSLMNQYVLFANVTVELRFKRTYSMLVSAPNRHFTSVSVALHVHTAK